MTSNQAIFKTSKKLYKQDIDAKICIVLCVALRVDERMSGVAGGRARVSGHSRGSSRTTSIVTRLLQGPLYHVNFAPDMPLPSSNLQRDGH